MDSNYANAGGGVGVGATAAAAAPGVSSVPVGVGSANRYNVTNCQRTAAYSAYDPYGNSVATVRTSAAYPYDAEAEFKERTGMGKAKASHMQIAGSTPANSSKLQQYPMNPSSCYGGYSQSSAESANYYGYTYEQHPHSLYAQQQQQQQQYHHQSQLQQQYKYSVSAKVAAGQQQQQSMAASAVTATKMSPPEYGYAPYHHLQHPYYHPHYHHPPQKGGVGVMKTIQDASAMPYVNSKVMHSAAMGGARNPQYQSNFSYYPSAGPAGHHTYQSQSVCDDSRWMWNNSNSASEYQNSCRGAYPSYVNGGSAGKQSTMWPSMQMQYQNATGYPTAAATVANQNCCPPSQTAANYYPQQYVKYPVSAGAAVDYNGCNGDLYGSTQVNATSSPPKVYTDLNAQPQRSSYQNMNTTTGSFHHQPGDYPATTSFDYNARYLQPQQTDSPSSSSTSSSSSYNHHFYHSLHPYAHQAYTTAEPQGEIYTQQQVDSKIGITTKSQSLRDFLTSWNEDEDECAERNLNSVDVPFMDQLHLAADHYAQSQEPPPQNGISAPIVENHLQFKGSFSSRPKIHVGITVDSTVESADQYINLPDIIIDIEKSNKDVVAALPEDVLVANIPKAEKDEKPIKEEKLEIEAEKTVVPPTKKANRKVKLRRKVLRRSIGRGPSQLKLLQRRRGKLPRKLLLRPKMRRVKKTTTTHPPAQYNPLSLKCLCVSLINSDQFRSRILGPFALDSLIQLTISSDDALATTTSSSTSSAAAPTDVPKLSDLCKNALNSSFDRDDVLVINLDEILDSDNLFVVQCDINENILASYVDQPEQQLQHATSDDDNDDADLVEILNDNNNNYNSSTSGAALNDSSSATVTPTIAELKRCRSVTEVSNLPLDNAVEHNNNFSSACSSSTNPRRRRRHHRLSRSRSAAAFAAPAPPSPCSRSCPAALPISSPSSPLIEQNCSTTRQISVGHEQLHDMLMLADENDIDDEDDRRHPHELASGGDTSDLLLVPAVATPSFHHEEIVPDNLKKFQNEKFLKYLHAKYVQGNLSEFYHANRIIKKYKRRIIKKILNIVR